MAAYEKFRPSDNAFIVKNLIILNVLVYLAQITLDKSIGLTSKIMLHFPLSPLFQPFQVVTHMFAHDPGSFFHILFNMFGLWIFGKTLEQLWGPKKFLFFYLVCGLGAAACHLGVQYFQYLRIEELFAEGNIERGQEIIRSSLAPVLGASGAVMGVFAAFAYLFPNTELYVMFIPVPVKAKWVILVLVLIDLVGALGAYSNDNVARVAHLGGALIGFLIVFFWNRTNRRNFY